MLIWNSGDIPYGLVSARERSYYISLQSAMLKGSKIKVTELDASGTAIGQPVFLSSDVDVVSAGPILHTGVNSGSPILVWTEKATKTLNINVLGTKRSLRINAPFSDVETLEKITVHAPRSSAALPHLLIHYQASDIHWAEVYHIDPATQAIVKARDVPRMAGKGAFSASSSGTEVYFTRHTGSQIILFSSVLEATLSQWSLTGKSRGDLLDIANVASEVIPRSGSTYAVRSAETLPSGDWELVRNGELFWKRHEGLSGTVAAAFLDIAEEESLAEELAAESKGGPFRAYVHRIKRHVRDLSHLPAWAEGLPARFLGSFIGEKPPSQTQGLRRDGFGFRKIVLIATENGRLAALDVGEQGKVIWSVQAISLKPGEKWQVLSIVAEDDTALVRLKNGGFLRVGSRSGEVLQNQKGGIISSLRTTVPVVDASGSSIPIPVNDDGSVGDIPAANFRKGTILVTEANDGIVRGWSLTKSTKPTLVWQFLPSAHEKVHSVSARPVHDPVASIGKALGDRNVLYKYLNPNLLLITTIGAGTSTATFYLIDSTSGVELYSTSHPNVDINHPIVSTLSENWIAYSLYSELTAKTQGSTQLDQQKLKGYQIFVSELYESPYPNDRGSLLSTSNYSNIYPSTEDMHGTPGKPHVISQTFLLPGPIASMSITSTLQGITTRALLCVISDLNSVISISRAFLDPRRPVGRDPTTPELEEGLFRYHPSLEFEPKWVINHKRELLSVSNVITSPSLLESTSLVFAFGEIDLFGTRVSPIGAFDILGKGFSKLQLVLTVVALAVGTTIVAPFVS